MACCGQTRTQTIYQGMSAPEPDASITPAVVDSKRIAFRGEGPVVVRGDATGFAYLFSNPAQGLEVDGRDAAFILEYPGFELVEG